MSVVFEDGYSLPSGDQPLSHARIAHASNWYAATSATASSTLAQSPIRAAAVLNSQTYDFWKPASLPATIDVELNADQEVDYICIGAHTLSGCEVEFQYFDDATSAWVTLLTHVFENNMPLMAIVTPTVASNWRLSIRNGEVLSLDFLTETYGIEEGGSLPRIGVIRVGKALQMQRPTYMGNSPSPLNRTTETLGNISDAGQWLGRSIIKKGVMAQFSWDNLELDWYRANFDPFVKAIRAEPFFIAWNPTKAPEDVGYLWTDSDTGISISGPVNFVSVGFKAMGVGYD